MTGNGHPRTLGGAGSDRQGAGVVQRPSSAEGHAETHDGDPPTCTCPGINEGPNRSMATHIANVIALSSMAVVRSQCHYSDAVKEATKNNQVSKAYPVPLRWSR